MPNATELADIAIEAAGVKIGQREAVFGAGDEAASGARRQRSNAHRRVPAAHCPGLIEPKGLLPLDIDPIERAFPCHPDRALAEVRLDVGDACHLRLVSHGDAR